MCTHTHIPHTHTCTHTQTTQHTHGCTTPPYPLVDTHTGGNVETHTHTHIPHTHIPIHIRTHAHTHNNHNKQNK